MKRNYLEWAAWTAVGVTMIGLVIFASQVNQPDPALSTSPMIGRPVPSMKLEALDGRVFATNEHEGEILIINFWASWCAPCEIEHPELVAAANTLADSNVVFVGVVYSDDAENANRFLDRLGRADTAYYVMDPNSRTAIDFGLFGIPETFFVNEEGIIVGVVRGGVTLPLILGTVDQIQRGETPGVTETGELFPTRG